MPWIDEEQWMWLLNRVYSIDKKLDAMSRSVSQKEAAIMATMKDVLDQVAAEDTKIDSFRTLFDGLKQQLTDALASAGQVTPAMQAQIDQVFNQAKASSDKIDAAIAENTPPTPTP